MTTNTSELIAAIREWQRADAEVKKLLANGNTQRGVFSEAYHMRGAAARCVLGSGHSDNTLAAFVALADHCERLEALLTEARAAMQVFRNPMDVPNTDISESLTINYVCIKIDAALLGDDSASGGL